MAGQLKLLAGPAYMAGAATDILTTPASGFYNVIRHIHFANVTSSSATFSLYLGATGGSAGGTELFKTYTVAPNSSYDFWTALVQANTKYISGLASATQTITITIEGEANVSSQ